MVKSLVSALVLSVALYACQQENGGLLARQVMLRDYCGRQSRRFYDGKCEGFKAMVLPMAGDRTIFTDLPKSKDFCESFEFEGVRD